MGRHARARRDRDRTLEELGEGRTRIVILMQMHTPEERDGFLQSGMQQGMDAAFAQLDELVRNP